MACGLVYLLCYFFLFLFHYFSTVEPMDFGSEVSSLILILIRIAHTSVCSLSSANTWHYGSMALYHFILCKYIVIQHHFFFLFVSSIFFFSFTFVRCSSSSIIFNQLTQCHTCSHPSRSHSHHR